MKDIKNMTNAEFLTHLTEGYSKYGALVQMVVIDCLAKGLDQYIENKDEILADYKADCEAGKFSFMNMESWVACCEETKQRFNDKYNG